MSDRMDINRVLLEMRSLKAQAQAIRPEAMDTAVAKGPQALKPSEEVPNFGQLLDQAVNKVNDVQKASNQLATAYEQGQTGVDITDVMIASQKASVSFQAMLQVRNKLVDAYRDIMNMPV
ncbi:MAG: flagellar hook-basal body complex protein FliE [Pseudomonadota bacterium]